MNLYHKLSIELLKKCWYFVKEDAKDDFIPDIYNYHDFAFNLEENIKDLHQKIKEKVYIAKPLLEIDVPKSSLTVRPGSVPEIEDRIITYAITYLLAPIIDKKLSKSVYSFRVKDNYEKANSFFNEQSAHSIPYLHRQTIKRISIIKEWYDVWPEFDKSGLDAYKNQGYNYLSISDISAYFENINHVILKETLNHCIPKQQEIINFIVKILETWTYRGFHGSQAGRGIPQGNDFSSFLGNLYLIPLDQELLKYKRKHDIIYLRYVDDVKVFSKNEKDAREVIFIMNKILRKLQLNLQGTKTRILYGKEIREELIDTRIDKLNSFIEKVRSLSETKVNQARKKYHKEILKLIGYLDSQKKPYTGKELRFFRRLITACWLLKDKILVKKTIKEINRNIDARLIKSSIKYFKIFPNNPEISKKLFNIIFSQLKPPFEYQELWFLYTLRFLGKIPITKFTLRLKRIARNKTKHWAVRCQAILLLSQYEHKKFMWAVKLYEKETNTQIRQALLQILAQEKDGTREIYLRKFIMSSNSKLNRTVRLLISLQHESHIFNKEIADVAKWKQYPSKNIIIAENLYKLYLLKDIKKQNLRQLKKLQSYILSLLQNIKKDKQNRVYIKLKSIYDLTKKRMDHII